MNVHDNTALLVQKVPKSLFLRISPSLHAIGESGCLNLPLAIEWTPESLEASIRTDSSVEYIFTDASKYGIHIQERRTLDMTAAPFVIVMFQNQILPFWLRLLHR